MPHEYKMGPFKEGDSVTFNESQKDYFEHKGLIPGDYLVITSWNPMTGTYHFVGPNGQKHNAIPERLIPWTKPMRVTESKPKKDPGLGAVLAGDYIPKFVSHTPGSDFYDGTFNKEKDPSGKAAKQPGSKLDAGKPAVFQGLLDYFPRACRAVANVSTKGAEKYSWKGWETVSDGENRYRNAMMRHVCDEAIEGRLDKDGFIHRAQVAWNALASLELMLRREETPISDMEYAIVHPKVAEDLKVILQEQGVPPKAPKYEYDPLTNKMFMVKATEQLEKFLSHP